MKDYLAFFNKLTRFCKMLLNDFALDIKIKQITNKR